MRSGAHRSHFSGLRATAIGSVLVFYGFTSTCSATAKIQLLPERETPYVVQADDTFMSISFAAYGNIYLWKDIQDVTSEGHLVPGTEIWIRPENPCYEDQMRLCSHSGLMNFDYACLSDNREKLSAACKQLYYPCQTVKACAGTSGSSLVACLHKCPPPLPYWCNQWLRLMEKGQ